VSDPKEASEAMRLERSRTLHDRASKVMPAGVGGQSQYRLPHPIYVSRARGSRLYDRDGNEFIDFMIGAGSLIHGHNHPLDGEFAFSPLILNYRYDTGGSFVPFIEGGEGIVLTTLDEMNLGGPFEFSSQGGGGIQWFFNRQYALTLDARYRHISNAGIKDQNSGLNTLFIGISIGHFPDRQ